MKNNILRLVGFFIALAFLASCENEAFEEYSSVPVADAPGLTLTIDSNTDSAITVSYNMDMAGRVTLAVLPASVDTPSIADMQGRPTADYYYYKHDEGDAQGTITYDGLEPYTEYIVYGVGQNLDGVFSEIISTEAVRTEDYVNPELVSYAPKGHKPPVDSDQPIVLTFSENVVYDNTKEVVFSSYFGGIYEVVPEDSISISGNVVTINWGILPYNDYCFISYEEGAFADYTGNPAAEVVSGVFSGYLEGIWFRVETDPATQLGVIFENFLGDYVCTDYSNADSSTVDWGPYAVTITEDPDVEYGVIVDNFWAWGITAKFQFHEDGTITCSEQLLDVTLGDVWDNASYDDYGVWVKGWSPDIYTITVGHWDYTDFSFNIALAFFTDFEAKMQAYSDIYQSYEKPSGKSLVGPKK
ncbi:MAG: Ig-like domain-containing protein [Bacteroidales bacterium]